MTQSPMLPDQNPGGVRIHGLTATDIDVAREKFLRRLGELGLDSCVTMVRDVHRRAIRFQLRDEFAAEWVPDSDTTRLCEKLNLDAQGKPGDLEKEILLAMLAAPLEFQFPSYDEFASAIRIRKHIVEAARKTMLAFDAEEAERPADYWAYSEECGFTVLPGRSLITALQKATQPDASGKLYSFSCYRATEYVILLGIARELAVANPDLFRKLQRQCEIRAIKSGEFHEVFLREHGSMSEPLPPEYYVPGDRVWFRNPDRRSSDVKGYEGSWVIYLGAGLFTNFWKRDRPFSLRAKCLEIFHWRHATCQDHAGQLRIDEAVIEARVSASMNNPEEAGRVFREMRRLREPTGVYVDGGCIDASREYPRWVCPGTAELEFPDMI